MTLLQLKLITLGKAIKTLQDVTSKLDEVRNTPHYIYYQDSTVQRFEYTIELFWKTLKDILKVAYKVETGGAKDTISKAFDEGLIIDPTTWYDMIDARNQASHIYDEDEIADLSDDIERFYLLIATGYDRLQALADTQKR